MRHGKVSQGLLHATLGMLALISLFPLVVMVMMAAKDPAQLYARFWSLPSPIRWDNFSFGFVVSMKYVLNSVGVSLAVCVGTLLAGMLTAYAFSVLRFRGQHLLYTAVIALMMVPGILMLVPLFLTTRELGLMNSYWGLILPQIAGSLPMAVFLFRNFFEEVPHALFDTARIDGAREWQVLAHIVVPLSLPIVSTVAIINVLGSWNSYIWPLLVVRDEALRTIPLGLAFAETEYYLRLDPGKSMATFAMASIPMVVCFMFAMKTFIKGMASGAIKG